MGTIILLMGVSSTGKTSIANKLTASLHDYSILGFDYSVEKMLPKEYWPDGKKEHEGFYYLEEDDGPDLKTGPIGKKFLIEMFDHIIAEAQSGNNITS